MDTEVDHYLVLGLPSGEEGAKLSEKEISKAYKLRALELHPDKRPDDPNAHVNFQKLKTSYEILKDEKARKLFNDLLQVKREKIQRQAKHDFKRQKMMSDLEERERAACAPDSTRKAQDEEERISRKLKEEIARIRAMHASNMSSTTTTLKKEMKTGDKVRAESSGIELDKEKVLKVTWEKTGEDYTAKKLKEIFRKYGEVEDVLIRSSKKKGSALIVMASKDATDTALGNVLGDLSNPLLVLPLQSAGKTFSSAEGTVEPDDSKLNNLTGSGYQAFEDSVLEKLKKAAQNKKNK